MKKTKESVIDSDHEIEEFLQEYIVNKVTSGYEASTAEIRDCVSEMANTITSINNSSKLTNQDISVLINNDNAMQYSINEIIEHIKRIIRGINTAIESQKEIKGIIPNEDKIIEALSTKWRIAISENMDPMHSDIDKLLADVTELRAGIDTLSEEIRTLPNVDEIFLEKYKLISSELSKLEKLLNCQNEKISAIVEKIDQVNEQVTEKNDELLKNDSVMVKGIGDLNQKIKWLWITLGVDALLIVGLFVALLCR